jgi:hypothetical protein
MKEKMHDSERRSRWKTKAPKLTTSMQLKCRNAPISRRYMTPKAELSWIPILAVSGLTMLMVIFTTFS